MAQDIFIKINGIDGESQDAAHLNEIDVISWGWQVSQNSTMLSQVAEQAKQPYQTCFLRMSLIEPVRTWRNTASQANVSTRRC